MGVRWSFEAIEVVDEKDERLDADVALVEARVEAEIEGLGGEMGAGGAPLRGGERGEDRGWETGSVGRSSSREGGVEGGVLAIGVTGSSDANRGRPSIFESGD